MGCVWPSHYSSSTLAADSEFREWKLYLSPLLPHRIKWRLYHKTVTWWRQIAYRNEWMLTKDTDFWGYFKIYAKYKWSLLLNLTFGCPSLKNPILGDKCSAKGKTALVRKPAILGRRWTHNPKNRFLTANEGARAFNGEFQGSMGRGDVQSSSGDWSCSGLLSSILIVVSTIFDSGVSLFPFPWGQFVELCEMEQFMSWLQSSHCVINFSHLVGVSVFKGCGSDCYL